MSSWAQWYYANPVEDAGEDPFEFYEDSFARPSLITLLVDLTTQFGRTFF
jgi:hypothetical protein